MRATNGTCTRRDFLKHLGAGVLAAGALAGAGCEDVNLDNPAAAAGETNAPPPAGGATHPPPAAPAAPQHADLAGDIANNHGHTVTLTGAQQDAGDAVTLLLTTGSDHGVPHTHTLDLEAVQVQAAAGGFNVARVSSTDLAHNHVVTFN